MHTIAIGSAAADRFLALHRDAGVYVERWQWLFGESMLRATSNDGRTATISRFELDELVAVGAVERIGCAGVRVRAQ